MWFWLFLALLGKPYSAVAEDSRPPCSEALEDSSASPSDETQLERFWREFGRSEARIRARLGFRADPFHFVSDRKAAETIWRRIQAAFPPYQSIFYEIQKTGVERRALSVELLGQLERTLQGLEGDPAAQVEALQGALLAIETLFPKLEADLAAERKALEKKGEPSKDDDKKNAEEGGQAQDSEQADDQPPEKRNSNLANEYRAQDVDTTKQNGQKQEPYVEAEVDVPGVLFFYGTVSPFVDASKAYTASVKRGYAPPTRKRGGRTGTQTVHFFAKPGDSIRLFVPTGFAPELVQKPDFRVFADEYGHYHLSSKAPVVQVPIYETAPNPKGLTPHERELYAQNTGTRLGDWPAELQAFIRELKAKRESGSLGSVHADPDIAVGILLSDYIYYRYRYRVRGGPSVAVPEAARAGKFQCALAGLIEVSILRDEFGIPAVVVDGKRGMKPTGGDLNRSFMVSPQDNHRVVWLFGKTGEPFEVDPTPRDKDEDVDNDPSGGGEFAHQQRRKDEPQPEEQDRKQESSKPSEPEKEEGPSESLDALIDRYAQEQKEAQEREDARKQEQREKEGKEEAEGAEQEARRKFEALEEERRDARGFNEIMENIKSENPLVEQWMKQLMRWLWDPSISGSMRLGRIHLLGLPIHKLSKANHGWLHSLEEAIVRVSGLIDETDAPFAQWAQRIAASADRVPLHETVDALNRLLLQAGYAASVHEGERQKALVRFHHRVSELKRALLGIRDEKSSEAIALARDLFEHLPGVVSKTRLTREYSLTGLRNDLATLRFAEAIRNGELWDYRMQSLLAPLTRFAVSPTFVPSAGVVTTWQKSQSRDARRPFQYFPAQNPFKIYRDSDLKTMNPEMDPDEAMMHGKLFVKGQRKTFTVPQGRAQVDPEKVTVLAVDRSGSMLTDGKGQRLPFVKQYLRALIDQAASDRNGHGRVRHRVFILLFDGQPDKDFIECSTFEEALAVLETLDDRIGTQGGSTDIEAALIKIAQFIRSAAERGQASIARATVALLSDGEDPALNVQNVRNEFVKARGKVEELLFAFVAIGNTNPDLHRLSTTYLGSDASMYYEFSDAKIDRMFEDAKKLPDLSGAFHSDLAYAQLPDSVKDRFRSFNANVELNQDIQRFWVEADRLAQKTSQETSQFVKSHPGTWKREPTQRASIDALLAGLRAAIQLHGQSLTHPEREALIAPILAAVTTRIGGLTQLTDLEMSHVRWLRTWLDTGKSGDDR